MKLQKIPLLVKVVSLYVGVATVIWTQAHFTAALTYARSSGVDYGRTIAAEVPAVTRSVVSDQPVRLQIPRLNISLEIRDGHYNSENGEWSLSDDAVQYAAITTKPNNWAGNTLLYGHNTVQVLEPTKALVPDDLLVITTKNGYRFSYRYKSDSVVMPENTSVLTTTITRPQLTLLTCNGWFSEHRRLMYFDFVGVEQ